MGGRELVMKFIRDTVEESGRSGAIIDVHAVADRLSALYPESGMSLGEICRAIERAAIEAQAVLLTGTSALTAAIWAELDHNI